MKITFLSLALLFIGNVSLNNRALAQQEVQDSSPQFRPRINQPALVKAAQSQEQEITQGNEKTDSNEGKNENDGINEKGSNLESRKPNEKVKAQNTKSKTAVKKGPKQSQMQSQKQSQTKAQSGGLDSKDSTIINGGKNNYISAADQDLNIKTVTLMPVKDNQSGIYAKPVNEELKNILNNDKQWSLVEPPQDLKVNIDFLDEQPQEVQRIISATKSDAVLTTQLVKSSLGFEISMTLFVGKEGFPLIQEKLSGYSGYETTDIKNQVVKLYENIKSRLPYRAIVLSRRGQEVTLNLGSNYGLSKDSRLSAIQILKANRHPKHKFLISTDKEVLGRIKIYKVEPYLSFGYIELEKEAGVIGVGAKLVPDEFVKYAVPVVTPSGKVLQELTLRSDSDVSYGSEPKEWVPEANPQFGKFEILGGLSTYTQNAKLVTAGSVTGTNSIVPNLLVRGELWMNPEWYMDLHLRQAIFSVSNGLSGSAPSSVGVSMSQYGVGFGYNFLLIDQFFGPKIQLSSGYSNTNFTADDSTPIAFTTMKYGGLFVGIAGQFPVSDEIPLDIGAKLEMFLSSSLNENKTSGSSSSTTINNYSFFGEYGKAKNFKIRAEIQFEEYSSAFTGTGDRTDPATSIAHNLTSILGGVEYLF